MNYKRIKTREDYFCAKTGRMQAKVFANYQILNPQGEIVEVVEAKNWQAFRRKIKTQRRPP